MLENGCLAVSGDSTQPGSLFATIVHQTGARYGDAVGYIQRYRRVGYEYAWPSHDLVDATATG